MTQTELLLELANECRYDKMVRPPGVINVTDPIRIYTKAFIYTIKSNMAKTLVPPQFYLYTYPASDRRSV